MTDYRGARVSHRRLWWLLVAVAVAACGRYADGDTESVLVDVGGHRLEALVLGTGEPTVVFEAGFIGGIDRLRELQARVAERSRTIAYERGGLGRSEAGPEPRDANRIADELEALLDAIGVDSPIVLVGHSAGGMFARVFASRYPQRLAGLVLADPATEDAYENWQSTDPDHFAAFEKQVRDNYDPPVGWYGQWHALTASIAEARSSWPLPAVPSVVLTALVPLPDEWVLADSSRIVEWRDAHERLVRRIDGAEHIVIPSADHVTLLDRPELLDAINTVLDRSAGR
jgi:pimeloyl-ACP methyl ester carboxylesterase